MTCQELFASQNYLKHMYFNKAVYRLTLENFYEMYYEFMFAFFARYKYNVSVMNFNKELKKFTTEFEKKFTVKK